VLAVQRGGGRGPDAGAVPRLRAQVGGVEPDVVGAAADGQVAVDGPGVARAYREAGARELELRVVVDREDDA
jgi:hypothetical protein